MKVLTAPTCLYHPRLAPSGQLFAEGETHPGEGWADSPAAFAATTAGEGAPAFIARLQLALEDAEARIADLEGQLARRAARRKS